MSKDDLGDRMKWYESATTCHKFMPYLPVIVRLDGKSFHTYTKSFDRPFDATFAIAMKMTASYLAHETQAVIAYTQSDEITLVLYSDNIESPIYFDGKHHKIISSLSSMATAYFNNCMGDYNVDKGRPAFGIFDCRAFQVPTKTEAVNALIWRGNDALKNSVQMLARSLYRHRDLEGKKMPQLHDMIIAAGSNWNDLPRQYKQGVYIKKAMKQLDGRVKWVYEIVDNFPDRLYALENAVDVIFDGAPMIFKGADNE